MDIKEVVRIGLDQIATERDKAFAKQIRAEERLQAAKLAHEQQKHRAEIAQQEVDRFFTLWKD